ncbi:phenylalanine--tRNA ligase subunit beta [Candidatus Woesearchaeota archaeon]|nr:phenylalanine--tRNA ligase subunit beta [Candidatus Woesearchaeota archaeon]
MPTITLNKNYLLKLLNKKISDKELEEKIPMLGTDLSKIEKNEIVVEVFPNRPDMLSEEGFARALSSFLGIETGLRKYEVKRSNHNCKVEKELKSWPYAVTAIVKGLEFDDEKIREIIQLQEKLHLTHLRDRKKGGIGVYPLDKIAMPIKFTSESLDKIKFRPLESNKEMTGREILEQHPTGKKYRHVLENEEKYPVFVDNDGNIMSMPPIINSHLLGKVDETTKDVFIEATGTDLNALQQCLNIIVTTFADMGGEIYSMDVLYGKERLVSPNLRPIKMKLDVSYVNKLLGLKLGTREMKVFLKKMGLDYEDDCALIPRYRVDILHPIDLVEEVAIAHGYENFVEQIPNVSTIGEESEESVFYKKIVDTMVGLGFLEVNTYHLTNEANTNEKMNNDTKFVALRNSLNVDYSILRNWMIPNLMDVLSKNKHNEYPQKIFEIGACFKDDDKEETSIKEFTRLGVLIAHNKADFTEIKQVLDSLFNNLALDYKIEKVKHGSFIDGRVGRVNVKGKNVAYIGEIHPQVISNWDLELPVVALELNLSDLMEVIL